MSHLSRNTQKGKTSLTNKLSVSPPGHSLKYFTVGTLFLSLLLLFTPLVYAKNNVIKISTDPWEPWVLGDEGGPPSGGLAVELSKELFRRIGLEIEINIYPYQRCISQMKNGERDVLLMVKKTKEREKYMLFSNVAASDPQLVYYSTDRFKDFNWKTWKDFKAYSIGGVRGFNYGDFNSAVQKLDLHVEWVSSDAQNISKLLAGRVDFILLSQSTTNYFLTKNPQYRHKLKAASKPVADAQFHISLSKKGRAVKYLNQINKVLDQMKIDGSLDRILMQ